MRLAALVVTTLVVATLCVSPANGGSSVMSNADDSVQASASLYDRITRKQSGRGRASADDSQSVVAEGREKPLSGSERRAGTSSGRTQSVSASRNGDEVRSKQTSKNVSPSDVATKADAEADVKTPQRSTQSGSGSSSRGRARQSDFVSRDELETAEDESRTCEIREQQHMIVDVQQSYKKGAQGILKTNTTYDDCITQCCANKQCNTAVFESGSTHSGTSSRRSRTSTCYLFNCNNLHDNRCVLSAHPQYTTIQMAAAFHALGEQCDELATVYCRDMQAVCTNSVCQCAKGYVKQYGRCVPLRCGPDEFQCWTLPNATDSQAPVCIASYNRCDSRHIPQCPDGSDEFDCPDVPETANAAHSDPDRHSNNGKSPVQATTNNDQQRSRAKSKVGGDADYEGPKADDAYRSRGEAATTREMSKQRVTAAPKTKAKSLQSDTHDEQSPSRTKVEESESENEGADVDENAPAKVTNYKPQKQNAQSGTSGNRQAASLPGRKTQSAADESEMASDDETGRKSESDSGSEYPVNQHGSAGIVRPNVSVSASRGKSKGAGFELPRTTAKAERRKPTPAPVFDTESEFDVTDDAYDQPYNRRPTETGNSKSKGVPVRPLTSTAKPPSRSKVKPTAPSVADSKENQDDTGSSYGQVARALNDLRERQRAYAKTSRRPSQYFTSNPRGDAEAEEDADADAELSENTNRQPSVDSSKWRKTDTGASNWKPSNSRHVTTRPPLFDDWYELPMPPDEPEQEQEQEEGCVTDYEAFTEAGAGRYAKRNRTLCTPTYDFPYGSAKSKVKSKPKAFEPDTTRDRQNAGASRDRQSTSVSRDRQSATSSRDRQTASVNRERQSTSSSRDRNRDRDLDRPSKSQQYNDAYYAGADADTDTDNDMETEEYDYDEAPHYYDDVMSDSESPRMRGRERTRYGYGKSSYSNTGRVRADEDEEDYEAAVQPERNRPSLWSRSRARTTGAANSRKTTARTVGQPLSTPKAAARIDEAPQPYDSVFGANITQMWNVHAILNGLFEHRGAQLEDSSVSEQNALIVAIVLLVGGLVMTTVLIALVGCNLRRLLGLSKRRYPRRSANGDAERLVNGLNL